jgi:hypothetical protein
MTAISDRLVPRGAVRFRRVGDEGVVVNQAAVEALVLNDVALRLLELSDGTRTIADCASVIVEEFEADREVVEADLLDFARELCEAGVVEVR